MKATRKSIFGTIFTLVMLMASTIGQIALYAIPLAVIAPAVSAANGLGEVTFMSIDGFASDINKGVQTVNTTKEHVYRIHNNDTGAIDCMDEIIITYPATWQGGIDTSSVTVTNMGAVLITNEKDDGTFSGLTNDDNSIRIVPDTSLDGVMLCPSGTTEITIPESDNLASPLNPEDSQIKILTSDQAHNEPSGSFVRLPLTSLPVIHVTKGELLNVQYLDFTSTGVDSGADLRITASARGAWGRLTELYLKGTVATTIDVYMDNGDGVLGAGDRLIRSGAPVGTSTTSVGLNNYAAFDVGLNVNEGFVKDVEQGGTPVEYYIDITGAASTLTIEGHADEDGTQVIDPTYSGTSYTNPPKEGTVLNVEVPGRQRLILVQLVREDPTNSSRLLDVLDDNIPIYFTTTLSSFSAGFVSPRLTDSSGQVEISLEPGTTTGNAFVEVCFPDPTCTDEDVAIAPGVADSCAITKGLNTEVEAGSIVTIEATVYDQYGNPISNNPSPPTVSFNITSAPGPDADLDDDINPPFTGDGDGFESEQSNFGIADVSLQTSATVGNHVVKVKANGLDCGTTTIKGVLGQAGRMDCQAIGINDSEIKSDQCFDVLMHVVDANGNPLPVWESLVEFSLTDTDKTIVSTNLREAIIFDYGQKVKGKLNPNNPAFATVRVCGCDEIGQMDFECRTDTLEDDHDILDVINSKPTCIDIDVEGREDECDDTMQLHTSIRDTCGNKVVDQECAEGGFASSCVLLEATCGQLSTEKTCVDLGNTGQAPLVDFDISDCECGDIKVNATDTADCCDSVYEGALPECDFDEDGILNETLVINKQGPATHINMTVYPKADNQDNFWVSEKTVIDLTLRDECEQIVTCEEEEVNITLTGEDCVNDTIQVDSPLVLADGFCRQEGHQGQELECPRHQTQEECEQFEGCLWELDRDCEFENEPVHKVVIQNCGVPDKDGERQNKNWTDLPEKDDIVVDKIAFEFNGPSADVEACVFEETEAEAGFQPSGPNADLLWKCIELDTVPNVPSGDADTGPGVNNGAFDEIHTTSGKRNESAIYFIELDDRISKFNGMNEYDNQRLGGSVIQAGDSRDYYLVISSAYNTVPCGTYDADYLFFEDYNSPDIINWTPYNAPVPTHVIDTLEGTEQYTRRNDDYDSTDPYPVTTASTPDYGFGDRILQHANFFDGQLLVFFRDLVAETVNIHVDSFFDVFFVGFPPAVADDQAKVTFLPQPATQVVALNHGDLSGDDFICDGAGFEPSILFDPDDGDGCHGQHECEKAVRDCRPAKACDGEGYDINLRVTDGFQNPVNLSDVEIQLDACLEFPHFIYLGDSIISDSNITVDLWEFLGLHDLSSEPRDVCFNMAKFKAAILRIIDENTGPDDGIVDEHPGPDKEFLKSFVGSEEFDDFVSSIFDDKEVLFFDENGVPVTERDAAGHLIIRTNNHGKAKFRVESNDSSMFEVKSFDTSYRIFVTPHALDGDFFDVAFAPGAPDKWDIIAVPATGIPADGEQEAKLLIRKLDDCGNPIHVHEEARVTVNGSALISRDFSHNNNYDQDVTGDMSQWSCKFLFPWFDDCHLELLDDVIETVNVTIKDPECEQLGEGEGFCELSPECNPQTNTGCLDPDVCDFDNQHDCEAGGPELCRWVTEEICEQEQDSTLVTFVGAPVKLKITEIKHSDLLPADGWFLFDEEFDLPRDACTNEELRECFLGGEPEICFKNCVQYGNNGAWVTVEVQDKFGQRVTGYLGDGFKGDPGDVAGKPDNIFEKICVALDDPRAFISDATFGWIDLDLVDDVNGNPIYCGDLAFGRGLFKVNYKMLDEDGQPLDPRETRKVIVSVFDVCDRDRFEEYPGVDWKEERWDDLCNGQEYNENNLPDSETASRLDPDSNKIIFVPLPDRWDIKTDKLVVAADGQDFATLTINPENEFMEQRMRMDATVQSSLLGSKLESEAITPGCYVKGISDPLNPTSINVQTEDCSGGKAELKLSSTKPGTAHVTVSGNGFGCKEFVTGREFKTWFEATFGFAVTEAFDLVAWEQTCVEESTFNCTFSGDNEELRQDCVDAATTRCEGLALSFHIFFTQYQQVTFGDSTQENTVLYTPFCKEFGVIPLTPKTIDIDFKQSYQDKIELKKGWNFFSVPYELNVTNDQWSELNLNNICDASASWNDAAQTFIGTSPVPPATVIKPLEGFWCKVSSDVTIPVIPKKITGVTLPPTKNIFVGWNDVGLSTRTETLAEHALISIDDIYRQLLDWLENLQRYFSMANTGELGGGNVPGTTGTNNMQAGQGYFIYTTDTGTLAGLS